MEPFSPSFSEIGLDYELGTELYKAFKVSASELAEPSNMAKLKRIATFLKFQEDPRKIIRDVVLRNNSKVSNLDYMDNLVGLYNDRAEALKKLVQTDQDIQNYERTND